MAGLKDLMRDYERARYPEDRRLDLHGEGPRPARERALHWIQSRAHETPGEELLLIVERGGRPGRSASPVETEVRKLLEEIQGRLIDWWQPFAPGSLAVKVSLEPRMEARRKTVAQLDGEGRTEETAGAARPPPHRDIPPELIELATRAAELRIEREGLSMRILEVVLREVWIEAQALAMEERVGFDEALRRLQNVELRRMSA